MTDQQPPSPPPGFASTPPSIPVARDFLPTRNMMFLEADFGPLFAAHEVYRGKYDLKEPPPEALTFLQRTLQANVLWTSFLPNGTSTAWSLLLPGRGWRLFVAASSDEGRCISRWSPCEPDQHQRGRLFECQSQRPQQLLQRSAFEPSSANIFAIIEEFFRQSQQSEGRLFHDEDSHRVQMLIALADWEQEWYAKMCRLPPGTLLPEAEVGERHPIGEPPRWAFDCGCEPERLRRAIVAAAREDVHAVFGDESEVDVECPRCGREHRLRRP